MKTLQTPSTTDMEVTSIRLETALKDQLKTLAGGTGYQALIREILWQYVNQATGKVDASCIRSVTPTTLHQDDRCTITGIPLQAGAKAFLALTHANTMILIAPEAIPDTDHAESL